MTGEAQVEVPATRPRPGWAARLSLGLGLLVLAGLWSSPLVPLSHRAFSPHMMLHLGIVVLASPLLGLAISGWLPAFRGFREALSWCLLASSFELVAVWGWHIPLLHDAAGRDLRWFAVEQASFLAGGIAMWTAIGCALQRRTVGAAAIALFLTFSHMTIFGLLLTLAPRLIYDPELCRGAFGLDRLADQQLGGVLMTVVGGLPYLAGTVGACWLMLSGEKRVNSSSTMTFARRPQR